MNISINYECKAFLEAHTGVFWNMFVTDSVGVGGAP